MAVTLQPERLPVSGLAFPESPRWHQGKLWISDMFGDKIVSVEDDGRVTVECEVRSPRGIEFLADGTMVVGTRDDEVLYALRSGRLVPFADLSAFADRGLNDMVVDTRRGCIYVDAYRLTSGFPDGSVVLVRMDGSSVEVVGDLSTPNGLALTEDGSTLFAALTGSRELVAFSLDDEGLVVDHRLVARLSGRPDGICLDRDGGVWVSLMDEGRYVLVAPDGGITHEISLPGLRTAAVLLCGPRRDRLLLCASRVAEPRQASDGHLYTVDSESPGAGRP